MPYVSVPMLCVLNTAIVCRTLPDIPNCKLFINFVLHTAIECCTLPDIPNGFITYSTDNTPNYDLGTVATYACDPGFVLDLSLGGSEMRTCVDDDMDNDAEGVFDNQAPICVRKSHLVNANF